MKNAPGIRIIREAGPDTPNFVPERIEVRELKGCETLGSVCRECEREGGYFKRVMGELCLVVEKTR